MSQGALLLALSLFVAQAEPSVAPPARFTIDWLTNGTHRVTVCGTNMLAAIPRRKEARDIFQVHVDPDDLRASIGLPPVSGILRVDNYCFHFLPQFPFEPGVRYRATFTPAGEKAITSTFEIPLAKHDPTTVVKEIYPTADLLPENLLKFYLYFSAPMSGGHIYEHIHLTDDMSQPVELPFLEIDEELWNPEMTRLTLFLDPGRIKRGVKPLEDVGPALEEGKSYTLTIASAWLDATGTPMKKSFQKKFRVAASDREAPDLAQWKITEPKAGTLEPLAIQFTDPMDHALALRMIRVEGMEGEMVLSNNETTFTFTPAQSWPRAKCRILVQTTIEDLAGNNIGKPFEVDLFSSIQKRIVHETASREFTPR